ncbi:hypothetical protein BAUCODRAFT_149180 [Baudoinia panamericana UAMH 10762]|uniref:DUF1746 domain-containing protein n=1 Tax=Baudoinia panamericana (strain UAMH 10762) TaxID=717646 RepID=M2N7V4_BAUPA|nr:uncharacterized protein BAUCODRAFT_149180 [Baudoinia panamericana UAMH 10762]EMC95159.1 hypothetical protein BAUCODRAFT_149180 [Baudoinia panamericana UAMH 10762]
MSDDTSSSAATSSDHAGENGRHNAVPTAQEIAKRRKKNREMFNKKRGELLDDLLKSLDILAYAELSIIYYKDCSFLRFFIRAIVQFVCLTPKPAIFPEPPANRPYIGGILGTNLLCILLHVVFAPPSAGEATRGYLHGGLALDFIGQKGPSSKLNLLLLDVLLVAIQIVQLSARVTRQRLKDDSAPVRTATPRGTPGVPPTSVQDLDAEERGVRRSTEQHDIEMQTLNPTGTAIAASDEASPSERDNLLAITAPRTDAHIFDAFNSGQIVLADLDIVKTIKEQLLAYQSTPQDPSPSFSDMRANVIGQLIRWRNGATVGRPAEMG